MESLCQEVKCAAEPLHAMDAFTTIADKLANPTTLAESMEHILPLLNFLIDTHGDAFGASSLWSQGVNLMLSKCYESLAQNVELLTKSLPTLFRLCKLEGPHTNAVGGVLTLAVLHTPKALVPFIDDLFNLVQRGSTNVIAIFSNMYKHVPDAFEKKEHVDIVVDLYRKDSAQRGPVMCILKDVAERNAEVLLPHKELLCEGLFAIVAASFAGMALKSIARQRPDAVLPLIDRLKEAYDLQENCLFFVIPDIFGILGRTSDGVADKLLPYLWKMLESASAEHKAHSLVNIRSLAEMDRSHLEPWDQSLARLKPYINSTELTVRDQANRIKDFMEGRTMDALSEKLAGLNKQMNLSGVSLEKMQAIVNERIADMKEFISDVVQKLPVPCNFSVEGKIRKTITLHFVCECPDDVRSSSCLHKDLSASFRVESHMWSKWLKVAFSAVKLGKALWDGSIMDAFSMCKNTYSAYKTEYDKDFKQWISQPFLLSSETDSLITQLRDAKFWDEFEYEPQNHGWLCRSCKSIMADFRGHTQTKTPAPATPTAGPVPAEVKAAVPVDASASAGSSSSLSVLPLRDREGFLFLQGHGMFKSWKHRYIKFDGTFLQCFSDEAAPKAKGILDMKNVEGVEEIPSGRAKKPFAFWVKVKRGCGQSWLLAANSKEEMGNWMTHLNESLH